MNDLYLDKCRCGGDGEFVLEDGDKRIFARCSVCGIRTPSKAASLDISAKQQVTDIWNAGTLLWPRWIKPAVAEDAYAKDARVSHNTGPDGSWEHWISNRDGNVWAPGESGWTLIGPAPNN